MEIPPVGSNNTIPDPKSNEKQPVPLKNHRATELKNINPANVDQVKKMAAIMAFLSIGKTGQLPGA